MSFSALLDSFQGIPALVVGDLMLDEYHFGHATRISPEAPVMVIRHEKTVHLPGGAANVALNLKALGAIPVLIGVAGTDQAGDQLASALREAGLKDSHLIRDEERPTTTKMRVVADHSHQVLRMDTETEADLSGNAERELLDALGNAIEKARLVVISDYLKGVLTSKVASYVLNQSLERGIPVAVNPKPRSLSNYAGADLISLNRSEAAAALGLHGGIAPERALEAACDLKEMSEAKSVLLTLGEKGMVAAGAQNFSVPAPKVEVYDTAGAGDTVIATAALGMASVGFKKEIFELAAQTAACVVRHVGVATPSPEDLKAIRALS